MVLPTLSSRKGFNRIVAILLSAAFLLSNVAYGAISQDNTPADNPKQQEINLDPNKIVVQRDYGLVKSRYIGKDKKLIIHIQDAHCNFEAQTNIIKILEGFIKNSGLGLISVEGADGFIDTTWFKAFPDEEVRKEVATYFMKKGEITGPEFLSITTDYPIKLFGAETRSYYIQNLNAFTSSYPLKEDTEKYYNQIKTILNKLKNYIYSEELKTLDAKAQDYEAKKLQFTDYVKFLESMAEKHQIKLRGYENLFKLVSVLIYEQKINFNMVDKERTQVIDTLTKKLEKDALTELVNQSLSFKVGKISSAEYYSYLKGLAGKYGISLASDYPNLFNYIIYNSVYSRIENEKLFKDIKELERAIKEKVFANDEQRTLDKLSYHIEILLGLVNIKLLNGDFDYYKAHKEEFSHETFAGFIKKMSERYGFAYELDAPCQAVTESMPKLEDFYEIAIKRDKALVDNTLQAMRKEGTQVCVLVTGGFHSEGITRLLEHEGVSYIVVCPNITKEVETPYIKILTNQRTPLEEILSDTSASTPDAKDVKSGMLAPILLSSIMPYVRELRALFAGIPGVKEELIKGIIGRASSNAEKWQERSIQAWMKRVAKKEPDNPYVKDVDVMKRAYIRAMEKKLEEYVLKNNKRQKQLTARQEADIAELVKQITDSQAFNGGFSEAHARLFEKSGSPRSLAFGGVVGDEGTIDFITGLPLKLIDITDSRYGDAIDKAADPYFDKEAGRVKEGKGRKIDENAAEVAFARKWLEENKLSPLIQVLDDLIKGTDIAINHRKRDDHSFTPQITILDTGKTDGKPNPICTIENVEPGIDAQIFGHASDNGIMVADMGSPVNNAMLILFELFRFMAVDGDIVRDVYPKLSNYKEDHNISFKTRKAILKQIKPRSVNGKRKAALLKDMPRGKRQYALAWQFWRLPPTDSDRMLDIFFGPWATRAEENEFRRGRMYSSAVSEEDKKAILDKAIVLRDRVKLVKPVSMDITEFMQHGVMIPLCAARTQEELNVYIDFLTKNFIDKGIYPNVNILFGIKQIAEATESLDSIRLFLDFMLEFVKKYIDKKPENEQNVAYSRMLCMVSSGFRAIKGMSSDQAEIADNLSYFDEFAGRLMLVPTYDTILWHEIDIPAIIGRIKGSISDFGGEYAVKIKTACYESSDEDPAVRYVVKKQSVDVALGNQENLNYYEIDRSTSQRIYTFVNSRDPIRSIISAKVSPPSILGVGPSDKDTNNWVLSVPNPERYNRFKALSNFRDRSWLWNFHAYGNCNTTLRAFQKISKASNDIKEIIRPALDPIGKRPEDLFSAYMLGRYPWSDKAADVDIVFILKGDHPLFHLTLESSRYAVVSSAFGKLNLEADFVGIETLRKAANYEDEKSKNSKKLRRRLLHLYGAAQIYGTDIFSESHPNLEDLDLLAGDLSHKSALGEENGGESAIAARSSWRHEESIAVAKMVRAHRLSISEGCSMQAAIAKVRNEVASAATAAPIKEHTEAEAMSAIDNNLRNLEARLRAVDLGEREAKGVAMAVITTLKNWYREPEREKDEEAAWDALLQFGIPEPLVGEIFTAVLRNMPLGMGATPAEGGQAPGAPPAPRITTGAEEENRREKAYAEDAAGNLVSITNPDVHKRIDEKIEGYFREEDKTTTRLSAIEIALIRQWLRLNGQESLVQIFENFLNETNVIGKSSPVKPLRIALVHTKGEPIVTEDGTKVFAHVSDRGITMAIDKFKRNEFESQARLTKIILTELMRFMAVDEDVVRECHKSIKNYEAFVNRDRGNSILSWDAFPKDFVKAGFIISEQLKVRLQQQANSFSFKDVATGAQMLRPADLLENLPRHLSEAARPNAAREFAFAENDKKDALDLVSAEGSELGATLAAISISQTGQTPKTVAIIGVDDDLYGGSGEARTTISILRNSTGRFDGPAVIVNGTGEALIDAVNQAADLAEGKYGLRSSIIMQVNKKSVDLQELTEKQGWKCLVVDLQSKSIEENYPQMVRIFDLCLKIAYDFGIEDITKTYNAITGSNISPDDMRGLLKKILLEIVPMKQDLSNMPKVYRAARKALEAL